MSGALSLEAVRVDYPLPGRSWAERLGLRPRPQVCALDGVDLQLAPGETLGLIGANGAGKSTLLRVAAGILEPDSGRVGVRGRTRALLELGAGFEPNRSARANARFLADLLGVERSQLEAAWEEVEAQVGADLDRPLRTYSQGMVLRLAFAVSTLDSPDLVLVDEAFLVGDEVFRGRALGTLERLRRSGAAMVFAGHDLELVRSGCDRALWLEAGRVHMEGKPEAVIEAYSRRARAARAGEARRLGPVRLELPRGRGLRPGDPLSLVLPVDGGPEGLAGYVGLRLFSGEGTELFGAHAGGSLGRRLRPGVQEVRFDIEALPLQPGSYRLEVALADAEGCLLERVEEAAHLSVLGCRQDRGPLRLVGRWTHEDEEARPWAVHE